MAAQHSTGLCEDCYTYTIVATLYVKPNPINSAMTYEQQLQQLETLIKQLENGDLSLDQTLAAYEQGVALIRACQQQLEQAEQRIQLLAHDGNGEETLVTFADPGDGQP